MVQKHKNSLQELGFDLDCMQMDVDIDTGKTPRLRTKWRDFFNPTNNKYDTEPKHPQNNNNPYDHPNL